MNNAISYILFFTNSAIDEKMGKKMLEIIRFLCQRRYIVIKSNGYSF